MERQLIIDILAGRAPTSKDDQALSCGLTWCGISPMPATDAKRHVKHSVTHAMCMVFWT